MTLQNGIIHGGSAHLWTDTQWIDGENGDVIGYGSKAFMGSLAPYAGVFSTSGRHPDALLEILSDAWVLTEQSLIDMLPRVVTDFSVDRSNCRLLIAACFDRPQLYYIGSDDRNGTPFAVYTVSHMISPSDDASRDYGPLDPARMLDVIGEQAQGEYEPLGPLGARGPRRTIGGQIVHLEVTPEGARSEVLGMPKVKTLSC